MSFLKPVSFALLAAAVSACSSQVPVASKAPALNNEDWYQVRTETQVYVFDDYQVFKNFLSTEKAPVLRKLEEKDPAGQELILALRAEDQGKPLEQIAAYQFLKVVSGASASVLRRGASGRAHLCVQALRRHEGHDSAR